jgi:hypothetical protein
LIVRRLIPVPEEIVVPAVLLVPVPVKLRLLIVKLPFSVVLRFVALFAVKNTFVVEPGSTNVSIVPAADVAKLVVSAGLAAWLLQLPSPWAPVQ